MWKKMQLPRLGCVPVVVNILQREFVNRRMVSRLVKFAYRVQLAHVSATTSMKLRRGDPALGSER